MSDAAEVVDEGGEAGPNGEVGGKFRVEHDNYAKQVAEAMIAMLEAGTAPWQRPWVGGARFMPYNALTGKGYTGGNPFYLLVEAQRRGFGGSRWCTYNQAKQLGGQVRKGEKGTRLQHLRFVDEKDKKGRGGGDDESTMVPTGKGRRCIVSTFVVFHENQIDGLPPLPMVVAQPAWVRHERAEKLLVASGADIRNTDGATAYYDSARDYIQMPGREQFHGGDDYYSVALHELGHWTGHSSRLDRKLGNVHGTPEYAREELRAELASLMLGDELGIGHDPSGHASYVASWIKALREDPREIFRASADARGIAKYVLGFEKSLVKEGEKAPAQLPPLSLTEAATASVWRDPAITKVVFVETPADVDGHRRRRDAAPGERYVVLGQEAIPAADGIGEAQLRHHPIAAVAWAVTVGAEAHDGAPARAVPSFELALSHTTEGRTLGRVLRAAIETAGAVQVVHAIPYNIGKRWATEPEGGGVAKGLAR